MSEFEKRPRKRIRRLRSFARSLVVRSLTYQRGRRAETGGGRRRQEIVRRVEHLPLSVKGLEGGELRQAGEQAARHRVLVQQVAREAASGDGIPDQVARILK